MLRCVIRNTLLELYDTSVPLYIREIFEQHGLRFKMTGKIYSCNCGRDVCQECYDKM